MRTFLEATGIKSDLICAEISPLVNYAKVKSTKFCTCQVDNLLIPVRQRCDRTPREKQDAKKNQPWNKNPLRLLTYFCAMIRRYLRLALAAAILAFATYQSIDGSWGNGIFLTLMAGFPVLLHFRNERILMALWYLRSQNFTKATSQLDALKHPDQTLIKGQLAYYFFLRGLMLSQTNLAQAESFMRKALNTGLRMKSDQALAKMQLAGMAMSRRRKQEAQALLTEAKKLDDKGMLSEQLKMLKEQLKRI